jgi:hypothetical protein
MKLRKNFNQLNWINKHLNLGTKKKNIKSTLMFTLFWNLFEHETCYDWFNINTIRDLINRANLSIYEFIEYYDYFKKRYTINGDINERFETLNFRNQTDREYVRNTFRNPTPSNEELISSLFLVIQRLRNNIFHGLKEISTLEIQEPNFNIANKAIATFLELTKRNY